MKTLKAVGSDLFDRQCVGRGEHRMHGDPVWFKMIVIFMMIITIMIVIFMVIIIIMIVIIMIIITIMIVIIIIISQQCVGRGEQRMHGDPV